MRDILTALAGAVILILVAAIAVPPFFDWAGHRAFVDAAISRSIGATARSEGRVEIRLLPFPRLRLDRLRLGADADQPALDLRVVKAELALSPLLKGEVRFTQTRVGRAEVRMAVTDGDAVLLPPALADGPARSDLVIDDLQVQQFLITTQVAATGRTDQVYAEAVRLKAPALAGPWQVEGVSGGIPFRLASSAIDSQGVRIKLSSGGDAKPRFEVDARLTLKPVGTGAGPARAVIPEAEGSARLVVGPPTQAAGDYLPYSLVGTFKARGPNAQFEDVTAEIDPGGKPLRLAGTGRLDLRNGRGSLDLETRRVDLDGLLTSPTGQALVARGLPAGSVGPPILLDLGLKVGSLSLGSGEWSDLRFRGTFDRGGGLMLRHFSATAPGAAVLTVTGDLDTTPTLRVSGHIDVDAPRSDGLGRYLDRLSVGNPVAPLLDGRPVKATSDFSAAGSVLSLSNVRLDVGETSLTGNGRLTRGEGGRRDRFDAQIAVQGLDLAEFPSLNHALADIARYDVGLTIQARDVRYGSASSPPVSGSVMARIQTDGTGLLVDRLDVTDVAATNAQLSGRIFPDGSGQIGGHLSAPAAEPFLTLVERLGIPEARLAPPVLRTSPLDLDVSLTREAVTDEQLRISATGSAARGHVDLTVLTRSGHADSFDATLSTPRTGLWFARDDIVGLRKPASLTVKGSRATRQNGEADTERSFSLTASGTLADLVLSTQQPIQVGSGLTSPSDGIIKVRTSDLAPYLVLAGAAASVPPLSADVTIAFGRQDGNAAAKIDGRIGDTPASARILRAPDGRLSGAASLDRLSLPGLAAALIVPTAEDSVEGKSSVRFGPKPKPMPADIALQVNQLELGRSLLADRAAFQLVLDGDALSVRDFSGTIASGQLTGSLTITRAGNSATIASDGRLTRATISGLAGDGSITGRISARLRTGSSGESWPALVANLAGNGELTLADLSLSGADPAALDRTLARALNEDDPLREGRVQAMLTEELSAGRLTVPGPVSIPATLGSGSIRTGPFTLDVGSARWAGTMGIDLSRSRLDIRGTLTAKASPKGWGGGSPAIQLGFSGPITAPERRVDAGPLSNGLAAMVLQRELEKIELFEADQSERERRRNRIEMDRARANAVKAAAEEAARRTRLLAEEAARQARLREEEAARRTLSDEQTPPAGFPPSDATSPSNPPRLTEPAPQP